MLLNWKGDIWIPHYLAQLGHRGNMIRFLPYVCSHLACGGGDDPCARGVRYGYGHDSGDGVLHVDDL